MPHELMKKTDCEEHNDAVHSFHGSFVHLLHICLGGKKEKLELLEMLEQLIIYT